VTSLEILLSHTVFASPPQDGDAIREEIGERLPDADLRVAHTPPESRERIATADVVVTASLSTDLLDRAESLQWVQAVSSGVDAYPRDRLREAGVVLTNAAGIHGEPIAEQVLGYLLTFERRLHRARDRQSRRTWQRYEVGELRGKTLGLVGVGAVGTRLAEIVQPFDVEVLGVKRHPETVPPVVDEVVGPDRLYDVLTRVDYLVVACPLTAETRGMLGHDELGALPSSAVLVNIARGEIVDQAALVAQLRSRGIRGAALDVAEEEPLPADSPLWDLPNAVVTPHVAGASPREAERLADLFAENYAAFVDDPDAMPSRVL
jgi:phosphoglycerate dehydrogenase-like enzyme